MVPKISQDNCEKTTKGVLALQVGGWLIPDIELNYFKFKIQYFITLQKITNLSITENV